MKTSWQMYLLLVTILVTITGLGQAAEDLQAVIETNRKKTITVTSISPDGWIEHTPVGGSKIKIFFKDIAKIEHDIKTREHTVTTLDGNTQKLTRAWIFTSGSGSYLKFTGTYQDGKDADGTISGGEIASIVFSRKATPQSTAKNPPVTAPAAKSTEAPKTTDGKVRPKIPSKRLPTGNLDYCYEQLTEFNKNIDGIIEKYNQFKSQDKLFAPCKDQGGNDSWNWLSLQSQTLQLYSYIADYYYNAINDGWETSDPDVVPLIEPSDSAGQKAAKIGFWSCFKPGEKLGKAMPKFFYSWDELRLKAFEAMILSTKMQSVQKGQELMADVKKKMTSYDNHFAESGSEPHPAFLRLKAEIARLEKECEGAFKSAGNAKDEAYAAWEALNAEKERLNDIMYEIENGQIHPNDFESFIEKLEKFENTDSAAMREKIAILGKTCGTDEEQLEESMTNLLGKNPSGWDWSSNVNYFAKILKEIPKLRAQTGEYIAGEAKRQLDGMSSYSEELRAKKFAELKKRVELGLRYDPHNTELIDLVNKVEEASAIDAAAIAKQVAERKWPGDHKGFSGPGTPAELNKAALTYFNATCRPVEKAHVACIVEPDWYCFKRNIFGQPIQWALTFYVAVDVEGETNDEEVYAWSISFLTAEQVGVQKAPPFKMAAFNGKKRMKRANVPGLK